MRTDLPQTYLDAAASERHHLRLVIEIEFDASNRLFFTSHSDIKNIPGTVVYNSVKGLSATSQKLNMIAARAEIGKMNFELVDKNRYVTDLLRAQSNAGRGANGRTVRLYKARKVGVLQPDFLTDFGIFQTQEIADDLKCDGGRYKVNCQDVQRNLKPEIFNPAKTRLAANFMKGATTLTVYQTDEFEFCPHGPSFTDTPGTLAAPVKVIYGVVESDAGKEIVRATAKTATTFTITGRGLFGTRELDHVIDGSPGADNGPEFTEFVYLELPAPKFAYALATGRLLGQGGADPSLYTLPSRWHLGVAESLMVTADFDNTAGHITDWYNPADDSGLVLRVDGAEKTEGKTWLETQVLLPMGAFMPVNSKGQLGLRRMTRILSDAATIGRLDERSITNVDDISYNLSEIFNKYELNWSYLNLTDKPKYWRTTEVTDQPSITKWKKEQVKTLSFQTLHASRHTQSVTRACIDWLRDMYAGPPLTTKLDLMPAYDVIEVGDVYGVSTGHIPDHLGTGSLNRSMMVIGQSVNQTTGKVTADMFGSTFAATPLADLLSGNANELPDAWYNSIGTALTSLPGCVVSGGVMTSPPTAGINGGTDINAANSIFYYLGDLTIPSSVLANITGNVWLRVRGHFQVEGEINGVGGGMAAGQSGFIGPTASGSKLRVDWRPAIEVDSFDEIKVAGLVSALPVFGLENAGGVLKGMPKDMRGTGSANAGTMYDDANAAGGLGVKGGAALCITSRGGGLGAAGKINLSGAPGNAGGIVNFQNNPNWQFQASSSGGGAPGCLLWQLDGALSTVPILPGRFIADYGALNYGAGFAPAHRLKNFRPIGANLQGRDYGRVFKYHSYRPGKGGDQVGLSACRIVFIPPSKTPYPDYVPPQLDAAVLAAEQAAADALDAQGDATAALTALTDIGADGKLAPAEKKVTIREYNDVINEQSGIGLRADGYGITTEKTTYNNAITALTSYLVGLSPAWNATNSTTTITRTTWNQKWNDVYTSRQALLNKIAQVAGERAQWTGIPDRPTTLYALDARSAAIIETRTDGALFSETFSDPNAIAQWEAYSGNDSGELSIGTDAEITAGGKCLVIGNNAGNDEVWRAHQALIPVRDGVLYRVRARVKRPSGTGLFYLGVEGIAADGVTRVNVTGAASRSSQHYFGAAGAAPGATFGEHIGYFKGFASSGVGGVSPSWSAPGKLHSNVRYVRPMFIANYDNAAGEMRIDYIKIEDVPVDAQGRPTELYNGDQNATADIALVPGSNVYVSGNRVVKYAGGGSWNASCYSRESFTGGAYVSFSPEQNTAAIMVGLNSDPTTNESYDSIDYAMYCRTDGALYAYRHGVGQGAIGTYIAGDVLAVIYDGVRVKWLKNGAVIFTFPAGPNQQLYMDSSFSSLGAISAVRFGPMTSNDWADVGGSNRPEDNATLGANLATNVTNRYATHLTRNSGDSTLLETIVQRIGNTGQAANQRFMNAVNVGSIRSRWDGLSLAYTATATTATITASAGTLRMGSQSVSYNSANVGVSKGAGASTQTFQLYYLDDTFAGGSRTLNATTDPNSLATADGVVWVGQVVVTFTAGGGGGGETGGGCVDAIMWVDVDRQAFDVPLNDTLDCPVFTEPPTLERRRVRQNGSSVQPCHRIVSESGAAVVASDSTPMTLRDGSAVLLPDMLGREVLVHDLAHRQLRWERVIECYPCGHRPVIKFNVGDTCLMAGESPLLRISTHNVQAKP